jgi:CHASE3 domain sensor protein
LTSAPFRSDSGLDSEVVTLEERTLTVTPGEARLLPRPLGKREVVLLTSLPLTLFFLVFSTWQMSGDLNLVRHSHSVIDEIINARSSSRQAREALHRYLLEADDRQLELYRQQNSDAWREVWRVKEMTLDSPLQKANAALFEQQLGDMFKLTDLLLAEKIAGHPRSTEARVEAEEKISDAFRVATGAVMDEERRILADRESTLTSGINLVQFCAALCAMAMLLLGYLVWQKL